MTNRTLTIVATSLVAVCAGFAALAAQPRTAPSPGAGPIVVVETVKGTFEFETYPDEAPKTVAHILALVKRNFYNGHRVHRVEPRFLVQFGDPKSRDMTKRDWWGRGPDDGSGKPIGVGEFSKKRLHVRGSVAIAHPGDAALGDSQIYISFARAARLDGRYTVFGQVISGMDVVEQLEETDIIRRVSIRTGSPASAPKP